MSNDPAQHTEHDVERFPESDYRVAVMHKHEQAVQYDLYIPEVIFPLRCVQRLTQRLDAIEHGATIVGGLTGVWRADRESTRIYRKIVRCTEKQLPQIREAIQDAVGQLVADLSAASEFEQESVMFTETPVRVTVSGEVKKV